MRTLVLLLTAVPIAFAGCFGDAGSQSVDESSSSEPQGSAVPVDRHDAASGIGMTVKTDMVEALVSDQWANGTMHARAIGLFGVGSGDDYVLEIAGVDNRSTKIVLELSWASPGNVQDLDLALVHPYQECVANVCGGGHAWGPINGHGWFANRNGTVGSPDSPARLEVSAQQIAAHLDCTAIPASLCVWNAWATWKQPVEAEVNFSLHVQHYRA